jgi:hypothetical protein
MWVAGITSEWWPASVRNGGRFQIGIPVGITSEYLAGMRRNLHVGGAPVGISKFRVTAAAKLVWYRSVRLYVIPGKLEDGALTVLSFWEKSKVSFAPRLVGIP